MKVSTGKVITGSLLWYCEIYKKVPQSVDILFMNGLESLKEWWQEVEMLIIIIIIIIYNIKSS